MSHGARKAGAILPAVLLFGCSVVPASGEAPPSRGATSGAAAPALAAAAAAPADFLIRGTISQGSLALVMAPPGTRAVRLDGKLLPLASDGAFLIGFGRDAPPLARLEATLADGGTLRRELTVAPRKWDIQSLPNLPKGTKPTPDFLRRRPVELARINAARARAVESEGWRQKLLWPVTGRISGVFGSQRIYAGEPGAPHSGVDIARPTGTPVVAPADGVVILAAESPFTLEGNLLMIGHGMGLDSAFLHLSRIDVKEGQRVTRGQLIGAIGATGRATGPHLHWSMKWLTERIDPQRAAGPMPGH